MDPRLFEFIGEMREFKRVALENFEMLLEGKKESDRLKWKLYGASSVIAFLVAGIFKLLEMK